MGKAWEQFKHLDEEEYAKEITDLDPERLTERHARITRKLISASIGSGFGVATLPLSGGFSLIPGGIQLRRTNVNYRRLKIIEKRIAETQGERYHARKRDFAIPTTVNLVTMGITSGVEGLLGTEGFLVDGSQFVAENAAGAADLANSDATDVLMIGAHNFIDTTLVQAGGTAADMAQEPVYTKVAEEANHNVSKRRKAKKAAKAAPFHRVPSVPSAWFAENSNVATSPDHIPYATHTIPAPYSNPNIHSVPSPRLMPSSFPMRQVAPEDTLPPYSLHPDRQSPLTVSHIEPLYSPVGH